MSVLKPARDRALDPPPNASRPQAIEVLRVWAVPGEAQQLVLRTTWKDAGVWGLLLADVARHAAKAYASEGDDEAAAFERISGIIQAELAKPN